MTLARVIVADTVNPELAYIIGGIGMRTRRVPADGTMPCSHGVGDPQCLTATMQARA